VRGDGFEVGQGAAGGYAGVFEERGIEQEGAAVDEGMIGGAEGASAAGMCRGAGEDALVHLQVGLKFQSGAGVPMLFAGEGGEEFLAKGGSVFAGHGFGFFVLRGGGTFGDQVECVGGHREERFALQESQEIFVKAGVDLQGVAAVFDDVGVDETGDDAAFDEGFAEALGECGSAGGQITFRIRSQGELMLAGVGGLAAKDWSIQGRKERRPSQKAAATKSGE